jgi:prolipoprotein diacylglyceryl transferase
VLTAIPSPSFNGVHVGPFDVRIYGLLYAVGISLAVLIAVRRWRACGGSADAVYEVALWGVPAGILGGRLYFDLTTPQFVPPHWWGPFAVWDGGLGIWGGIAAGAMVGIWRLRRRAVAVGPFMDVAVPGILVAQAIGRIGNYFNQELFGGPTSLPWAVRIDPAYRPDGYTHFATFHPTFLYELVFDLALAGTLVWLGRRRAVRPPGLFALYVAGYSAFRLFEESLRIDPAQHILGLRLNFYVAAALMLGGLVWFARLHGSRPRLPRPGGRAAAIVAVGVASALAGCGHSTIAHAGSPPRPAKAVRR